MPKALEAKLAAEAAAKGKTGRAAARYVYGTMNDRGYMHGNQETSKGAAVERKMTAPTLGSIGGRMAPRAPKMAAPKMRLPAPKVAPKLAAPRAPMATGFKPSGPTGPRGSSMGHPHVNLGKYLHAPKRGR